MTTTEISRYRKILNGHVTELIVSTRRRDGIAVEQSAEELERSFLAGQREVAMRNLENESANLREARAALRRINAGTYGICLECEEPISARRLAAVPAAALCIRCQETFDCWCGATNIRPALPMAA